MSNRKQFDYDSGAISLDMLLTMHPAIVLMIGWANLWCYSHGIMPTWTSWKRTPEKNKELGATSVHEWRAADLSIKRELGWTKQKLKRFEIEFRQRFIRMGAFIQKENGSLIRKPILRHDVGHGEHFHIQCAPSATVFNERGVDLPIEIRQANAHPLLDKRYAKKKGK